MSRKPSATSHGCTSHKWAGCCNDSLNPRPAVAPELDSVGDGSPDRGGLDVRAPFRWGAHARSYRLGDRSGAVHHVGPGLDNGRSSKARRRLDSGGRDIRDIRSLGRCRARYRVRDPGDQPSDRALVGVLRAHDSGVGAYRRTANRAPDLLQTSAPSARRRLGAEQILRLGLQVERQGLAGQPAIEWSAAGKLPSWTTPCASVSVRGFGRVREAAVADAIARLHEAVARGERGYSSSSPTDAMRGDQ